MMISGENKAFQIEKKHPNCSLSLLLSNTVEARYNDNFYSDKSLSNDISDGPFKFPY